MRNATPRVVPLPGFLAGANDSTAASSHGYHASALKPACGSLEASRNQACPGRRFLMPSAVPVRSSHCPRSSQAATITRTRAKTAIALLLLSCLVVVGSAQDTGEPRLFHVRQDGRYGYINGEGTMVIEPRYDVACPFSDGLAAVRVRERWGCIDSKGKLVIKPMFSSPFGFSEGLAAVALDSKIAAKDARDVKKGYIDKTGVYVIAPQFDFAFDFSDGMAQVSVGGRHGYVDKSGKAFYLGPAFADNKDFSEGLAVVRYREWGKQGYIDKTGGIAIEPIYDGAGKFSEGLAAVRMRDRWGYIDKSAHVVIQPQFGSCGDFSEGLAPVRVGARFEDPWGYIDRSGKMVVEPQFVEAREFKEGLAAVRIKGVADWTRQEGDEIVTTITGPFGFIDKGGNMVIEPAFTQVSDFFHGLAMINLGPETPGLWGKWAYIDKSGTCVWQPKQAK
jgi:hypothetical protein